MSLSPTLKAISKKVDDIYVAIFNEELEVVFRLPPIKVAEQYDALLKTAGDSEFRIVIYEHIFRNHVEDSSLIDNPDLPAGLTETITGLILHLSGLDNSYLNYINNLFIKSRNNIQTPLSLMKRIICSVFQAYTFETLENISLPKIIDIFIQAEQILLERGIIPSEYTFTNTEDLIKKEKNSLQEQIRQDQIAYNAFNSKEVRTDPRLEKLREDAQRKAIEEERKYKTRTMGG
jgi:hypothetical protein